ncbi:MAG TPA: protein kinase [Acidobacteriaceae bacterium]|jgi:serine/threonine-protein kinase
MDRIEHAEQLFGEILELPREQRPAFLDRECAGQPALRRRLEDLLDENDRLSGFLSDSPFHPAHEDAASEVAPSLASGMHLGRYSILDKLGAGGMGVVYRARDEKLERMVAIKILTPGVLTGEDAQRRFRQEALALAKLNHAHIAAVYDADEQDGTSYIAMELVEGESLAAKLRGGALPVKDATAIALQVAEALEDAHEHGVIHRDLKPGNVMITPKSNAKILDFGIAKVLARSPAPATSDTRGVFGTPSYMSPEQALGKRLDARTDLWSLGVLYYECLTGRLPFRGSSHLAILQAITTEPVPAMERDVPALVEQIVARALEQDPELRYQWAHEFATDLRRVMRDLEPRSVAVSTGATTGLRASPPARPRARWRWWALGAAAASLLLVAAFVIRQLRLAHYGPIHSLAVLPLDDLSPDKGESYFADGLTDELIAELAQIPALRVVSRTSVMREKGQRKSVGAIAHELGVEAIVDGSVLRSGDRVRITAELIDARSDRHLWAQTFEGPLGDILSLQDTVAREIATQTRALLTPADRARLSKSRTIRPEAYDDYLRGLYFIERREGERAAGYFRNALDIEPNYAPAWSGLAQALATEVAMDRAHARDVMPSAVDAARRAVQIDPDSGDAYIGLGFIELSYLEDWAAAERDLRHGIVLSPGNPLGHIYLSFYLIAVNRPDEAVAEARRAMELDPLGFWTNRNLGAALFYDRRYDASLAALRRATEIAPDLPSLVEGWNSAIAEVEGRYADAVAADLRGMTDASPHEVSALRSAFATGGWKAYQQTLIHFLLPHSTDPCISGELAMSYLRLGQVPEAFRWFEREVDEHCVFETSLAADPRLDPFRHDPHYLSLQDRLNLPH